MLGKFNSDGANQNDGANQDGSANKPKPTRLEIIGVLNAIIDLWSDAPKMPKTNDSWQAFQSATPPIVLSVPRVPRIPDKLILPEDKRRGDAVLDVLDTLRTYVKYSLFERDALRREVAFLKQMVNDLGGKI
ncbi:hypothetical protein LCGC14_0377790 [marine sediment metagenome]|uniref:Uncharacterized protein n=1 Tax=marine sediment metagenome TaxID=412755 RepID=A0A0F9VQC4_9ZZZZ